MSTPISERIAWNAVKARLLLAAALLVLMAATMAQGASIDWSTSTVGGGDPDATPELFYLFNTTTRRYDDILQWDADKNTGVITVSMRVDNGIATYRFEDKEWASLYLDDTKYLTSALNVTVESGTTKAKFDLDKWTFEDRGETLLIWREVDTKEELLKETWEFMFKLGTTPKVTFILLDLDDKTTDTRSIQWRIAFEDLVLKVKVKAKDNITDTKVKVKDQVLIDWSDFGTGNVTVEANEASNEVIVYFYDQGVSTNMTIDPSVAFVNTALPDVSYVVLGFSNTNNPIAGTEVIEYEWLEWYWYISGAPGTTYAVDHNPVQVTSGVNVYFQLYDIYGNVWTVPSFASGVPGTVTYLTGDIPLTYISVWCSNGIRSDGFHRWGISCDAGTVLYIDEPVKFPVIVDDSNPHTYNITVPEDAWIADAGSQTVVHGDLVGVRDKVLTFDVVLKSEPVTVFIRYYDATTGEGIPWETYVAEWDGLTMGSNVVQTLSSEAHTLEVMDYFGNVLYSDTVTAGNWDLPVHLWAADITAYSVKLFNQEPNYVHKIALQYDKAGDPYEFYIAPLEVVELFLKAADYRIAWTPYHWYVAQATLYFDLTVSEANYFLINGTLIANITTTQEGVYALTEIVTTLMAPDLIVYYDQLPHPPSGDDLGITYIHPYDITTADISYNYTSQSMLLWSPTPDRAGRNYTIDSDMLYFSGTYGTEVYINWSGNSTNRFHLTTLPATLDLGDGGSYTLWASASIDVTRKVTWREYDLFWWAYYNGQSKYEVTLSVNNTQNMTWRSVNWFVGWPEDRTVDIYGVKVYDVNNGITLAPGEHYDVTMGGVYFYWDRLNASAIRSFKITAWDYNATNVLDSPIILMTAYASETFDGRQYFCMGSWGNDMTAPYNGPLTIAFKFDAGVDPKTIIVWDVNRNAKVQIDQWVATSSTVTLTGDALGTIGVGHTAQVKIYFNKPTQEGDVYLFSPLVLGLSPWVLLCILSIGLTAVAYKTTGSRRENGNLWVMGAVCLWSLVGITWILREMEVIA